jgi:hypothetical protein
LQLKRNRDIGLYSPGWQLKFKLVGLAGNLPEWISRGPDPHRPDEIEEQYSRHHTRRYGAYDRDSTSRDCLEARSSVLVVRVAAGYPEQYCKGGRGLES